MHKSTKTISLTLLALAFTSCTTTTQTTSGADYLSRYTPAMNKGNIGETTLSDANIDQQVRQIAEVEPDLRFPARIGLARIERGRLTNSPVNEIRAWGDLADKLGAPYGEFVPVSPFIAALVRPGKASESRVPNVISDIRRASARQHLDYVLVYEVTQNVSEQSNGLSFTDLTILGMYVIPSRSIKINSTASAILIDVRNGYPYGTATAFASDKNTRTKSGSGAAKRKDKSNNYVQVVENLTGEVETMMKDLWVLQNQRR
ncbi:MAG: hypothetical protein COA91_03115 [Robiginitomaculum sp.]|nr:MAG: hypothetical protein COA91_03115 [Robiginitomaculum sp.]